MGLGQSAKTRAPNFIPYIHQVLLPPACVVYFDQLWGAGGTRQLVETFFFRFQSFFSFLNNFFVDKKYRHLKFRIPEKKVKIPYPTTKGEQT